MFTITADNYGEEMEPTFFCIRIQARLGTSKHTFTVDEPYLRTYSDWHGLATSPRCDFGVYSGNSNSSIEKAGGRIKFISALSGMGNDSTQVAEYDVDNFDSALLAVIDDLRAKKLLTN